MQFKDKYPNSYKEVYDGLPSDCTAMFEEVINNLDDQILEVAQHGMAAGFGGYIYYYDTLAFALKYKNEIIKLLKDEADNFGCGFIEYLQGWRSFREVDVNELVDQYADYRTATKVEDIDINFGNMMCWGVVESFAYRLYDLCNKETPVEESEEEDVCD